MRRARACPRHTSLFYTQQFTLAMFNGPDIESIRISTAQLLIELGVPVDYRRDDRHGFTLLERVCAYDMPGLLDLLIEYHADIHTHNPGHFTAITYAIMSGPVSIVRRMMSAGAKLPQRAVNHLYRHTPDRAAKRALIRCHKRMPRPQKRRACRKFRPVYFGRYRSSSIRHA